MQLRLRVTQTNNQTPQAMMQYEFTENGGTIGRKISNSWVLPDENRHLSGSHSKIEYDKGRFYIIDTSTNGVFINGNTSPVGKGNRQKVNEGDQLVMGTYSIQVSIIDDESNNKEINRDNPSDGMSSEDLFSDLLDEPSDEISTVEDQLSATSGFVAQESKYTDNSIGSDDPFFESGEFSLNDDQDIRINTKENNEDIPDLDSFFKPPNVIPQDDSVKALKEVKKEKEKEGTETENAHISSVIPDDWIGGNENSIDDLLTGIVDPFATNETSNSESSHSKPDLISEKEVIGGKEIEKEKKEEKEISKVNNDNTPEGNNKHFISTFFEGMGVDYNPEEDEFTNKDIFLAGVLFRKAVEGTIEVLQSRAEIKNEMRMDMTTIRPIENNPIKFSMTVEEAIKKLLLEKSKSQMNPEKAMDEAYDDIKSHQVAVISGIQASLTSVLKRFEPDNLIERLERQNPISANIPIHRKAKLWEAFEYLYQTIEGEAEDDFNRLFGQEFAKAYDDQVAKLKSARGDK